MATRPQQVSIQSAPQDDPHGQEFEDDEIDAEGEGDGQNDAGSDAAAGQAGAGDEGTGQAAGEPEDLGVDDDLADFFPPQRQPATRGQNRLQRLANENAELRRRLDGMAPAPTSTVQPVLPASQAGGLETDAQFNARIQDLPPDERMEQRQIRFEQLQNLRQVQREQQDLLRNDGAAFHAKVQTDARYARWADRVEARHQEFLRQGQFVPRDAVFKYLLGEHLLSQKGQKEAAKQAQRGKARVQRQTVKPGNAGSDVGGGRGRMTEAQARAKRLENINL